MAEALSLRANGFRAGEEVGDGGDRAGRSADVALDAQVGGEGGEEGHGLEWEFELRRVAARRQKSRNPNIGINHDHERHDAVPGLLVGQK